MNRGSTSRSNLFQGDRIAIKVRGRKLTLLCLLLIDDGMIDGSKESILTLLVNHRHKYVMNHRRRTYMSSSPLLRFAHVDMISCFNMKWTTMSSMPAAMVARAAMTERYA